MAAAHQVDKAAWRAIV